MKRTIPVATLLVVLVSGCHKSDSSPGSTAPLPGPSSTQSVAASQEPSPGRPVPVPNSGATTIAPNAQGTVDLDKLTMALRNYVFTTGNKPRKFEDFVAAAHLNVPPPPPGKKYVITPKMWVTLQDL
jgi:hypothetical protein